MYSGVYFNFNWKCFWLTNADALLILQFQTKCASRRAGYACGVWLIIMGVLSKIAGFITSIPDAVIGGMTIFLFSNVLVSGIALAGCLDIHSRRVKWVVSCGSDCPHRCESFSPLRQVYFSIVTVHWGWCYNLAICLPGHEGEIVHALRANNASWKPFYLTSHFTF